MFESKPVEAEGILSYVLDAHMIHDRFLAVIMKSSDLSPNMFIDLLKKSGGLVVVEQDMSEAEPLPEMLYLAKAAVDGGRSIKEFGGHDSFSVVSMCPAVKFDDILTNIKSGVKLGVNITPMDWLTLQCRVGLQDFTIRANSYATRDMRDDSLLVSI
ncbi:hypothetical protein VPHD528_0060 [Vibrio phage D528]